MFNSVQKITNRIFYSIAVRCVDKFIKIRDSHMKDSLLCSGLQVTEKKIFIGERNLIKRPQYMSFGYHIVTGRDCVFECVSQHYDQFYSPKMIIGNGCSFGDYTHVAAIESVIIEDNLLTGRFVLITDNCHGSLSDVLELSEAPIRRKLTSKPVVIGNNV